MPGAEYSLSELARTSGHSPRTIRFYIARGILPGPDRAGRGASYGARHVNLLSRIQRMKAEGLTLAEIALRLADGGKDEALPDSVPVSAMILSEDVQVLVRADMPPWRTKQVRRILAETARQLRALEQH